MQILIYLSEQKYHLTHILHTTKLIKVLFQLSWKNEPCSESFLEIHLDGVRKQNKMYSFEVSIGLLPHLFNLHKKLALFSNLGADLFRWSQEMEQKIQFWS